MEPVADLTLEAAAAAALLLKMLEMPVLVISLELAVAEEAK